MIMMPYNWRRLALAVAAGHTACRLLAPHMPRQAPASFLENRQRLWDAIPKDLRAPDISTAA
jgi:hypothetical protein